MAIGAKRIETRSWAPKYRGLVAIQAAKSTLCDDYREAHPCFAGALANYGAMEHGAVLAVGDLLDVESTTLLHLELLRAERHHEIEFGDYGPNRWGWRFGQIHRLQTPIPWKAHQGLYTAPEDLCQLISEQLPEVLA